MGGNEMRYFMFDDEEDCFEEEDLLTNFDKKQLNTYEKAIKQYGDKDLFISDEAYDRRGRSLKGWLMSLRTKNRKDLTNFWKLFRELDCIDEAERSRKEFNRIATIKKLYGIRQMHTSF
jgi:hypothetical protein